MSNEHSPRRPLSLKSKAGAADPATHIEERLHKVLAQAGLGSRRALEQRIAAGAVSVNGVPAQTGMSITGGDKIELDGKTFVATALTDPSRVLMYNKPEGEVTTREDPEGRPTIFDTLPALKGARWIAIGRLDINTSGLLLLTTDGELANALMHPSHEVEREYVCRVRAPEGDDVVSDKIVDRLARGVALDDGPAKFDEIERIGGTDSHDWYRVLLKEGRNREVRRLWESQGCQVSRLKRIRYGSTRLPQPLLRGHAQELTADDVSAMLTAVGLDAGAPSALTLMPVLGQRKAHKTVIVGNARNAGYVGGHNGADEGRELRRFDNVREDRGRRGGKRPSGSLTVSGDMAAQQRDKRMKLKGPRQPGQRLKPGEHRGDNPAAMRTWFVPDGVNTGPSGHHNPGGRGPKKFGEKPHAPRAPKPYGHPGNAPTFPSDHAGGGYSPYGARSGEAQRPRGPRPAGNRPGGGRPGGHNGPGGNRPGGHNGPGGNRPNHNAPRGPRPGGGGHRGGPRGGGR